MLKNHRRNRLTLFPIYLSLFVVHVSTLCLWIENLLASVLKSICDSWCQECCEYANGFLHFPYLAISSAFKQYWSLNWSYCFTNMPMPGQSIWGKCFSTLFWNFFSYENMHPKNYCWFKNCESDMFSIEVEHTKFYYMSIEIYVKYSAEIKFVFHCILYISHVKKVVSALWLVVRYFFSCEKNRMSVLIGWHFLTQKIQHLFAG